MTMYILRWLDGNEHEVSGNAESIVRLAGVLEDSKLKFKVSNSLGALEQQRFGFSDFKYWLEPKAVFDVINEATSVQEEPNAPITDVDVELRHIRLAGHLTRLYLIQTPMYGTDLSVYNNLFKKAKEYFPDLEEGDIAVGVVGNTGFMDGHAVISFSPLDDEDIPDDFIGLKWELWFNW